MKKNILRDSTLCLLLMLGLFSGCNVINPSEEIPSYLHIDNFSLTATVGEGTASNKITEAFVFVGGDFLGAYSLPTTFPVLTSGSQSVELFAGISDNGIAATPEIYPFYSTVTQTIDLAETEIDTIRPAITYIDDINFPIMETFENSLMVFRNDIDEDSTTTIELSDIDVFEGQKSARIVLSKESPLFQVASNRLNTLPPPNREVYLELNYKTEVPFEVGIYYYDNSGNISADFANGVNNNVAEDGSWEWNKVYINFTDQFTGLNNLTDLRDYQIGIRAVMDNENGVFKEGTRQIFLDNIKLIHF